MASSAVTSSSAKPLDPLRQSKFTLHVSDGLLSKPRETTAYSSVRYNYKPKRPSDVTRTSTISQTENERASLTLSDQSGDGASAYKYTGQRKDLKRSYALVFEPGRQSCTLEPLASSYSFNIQSTPSEPSAAKLAERYPKIKPKSHVNAKSGAGALDDEVDPNGLADDDNPFDFRHYMKRGRDISRSVSPDARPSQSGTPLNGTRTPLSRPSMGKASPMVGARGQVASQKRRSPPAGTTLSKAKGANAPEVRLERRASARPAPPSKKGKSLKSITQPRKNPTIKSKELIDSSDDDDDDGDVPMPTAVPSRKSTKKSMDDRGLEIDFGDSAPLKSQSRVSTSKKKATGGLDTPTNGPISLRSAANSATASPAHGFDNSPFKHNKALGDGQVIDFGDSAAPSDDDASDEDASGEDDHDIEPITLGSPAHETRSTSSSKPPEDAQQDEDHDADGDDDFDYAFEEAYQQLSEADNEAEAAPLTAAAGDESEVSEEE